MKRSRHVLALVSGVILLGLVTEAGAVDFSPTAEFTLSDPNAGANPELSIKVAQERDEEELQRVELSVPSGFTLPTDDQIPNNTTLGTGTITIDVGPRCRNPGALLSGPANVPVTIKEIDRNSGETGEGAIAKWLVDIQGVTSIPLLVKGSTTAGYTLAGNIPPNSDTCPPFVFNAKINKTAGNVQIIKNPSSGGSYEFSATFTGVSQSTATIKQPLQIKGPSGGGGGETGKTGLTAAEKKKCNKKKSKAARKKCRKKQRAD